MLRLPIERRALITAAIALSVMGTAGGAWAQAPVGDAGGGGTTGTVTREDLAPVMASDGSGLPHELWRGLTLADLESLLSRVDLPPRSPTLHALLKRLLTSEVGPPADAANGSRFLAVRVEALDRMGLYDDSARLLADRQVSDFDPILKVLAARTHLALGETTKGCAGVRHLATAISSLPERLRNLTLVLSAYCTAASGDKDGALMLVALAREQGSDASVSLDAIDAYASGGVVRLADGAPIDLVDWLSLKLSATVPLATVLTTARPGVLAAIAKSSAGDVEMQILAAEAAARLNATSPADLAAAYMRVGLVRQAGSTPNSGAGDGVRRAQLFAACKSERAALKRTRLIRRFLDDVRRVGLYWQGLLIVAQDVKEIPATAEVGWFAETAIESALVSGDFNAVRSWVAFGRSLDRPNPQGEVALEHWLALADIADPAARSSRATHLDAVTILAQRGQVASDHLHRTATVLDALDIQVPIPLWELASRTPQPATGHLPATGVLSALAESAKQQEFGRTVLLTMEALGPDGADGAHMIALGDAIRALRRAGLDQDARKLALEALFSSWPRTPGG